MGVEDDDSGGAVVPSQHCPHLSRLNLDPNLLQWNMPCQRCGSHSENWTCLGCYSSFCSRYVSGHFLEHSHDQSLDGMHAIGISSSDLSVWCHSCQSYIKHATLLPILCRAERLKFGGNLGAPVVSGQPIRTAVILQYLEADAHAHPTSRRRLEGPARVYPICPFLDAHSTALSECLCLPSVEAVPADLEGLHSPAYVSALVAGRLLPEQERCGPADVYLTPASGRVALQAAGSCAALGRLIARSAASTEGSPAAVRNGFALVRPPGHHAEADRAVGFCLLNNVAVAVRAIQDELRRCHPTGISGTSADGTARVLVVDWDLHHGNGIQRMFYEDPSVLYISVHRYEHAPGLFYSAEGALDRRGAGPGLGFNVNVPLPYPRSDPRRGYCDADYRYIFQRVVLPLGRAYRPAAVVVACGFDAAEGDPTARDDDIPSDDPGARPAAQKKSLFHLTPRLYGELTRTLMAGIPSAQGRLLAVLEGGYQGEANALCANQVLMSLVHPEEGDSPASSEAPLLETTSLVGQVLALGWLFS
ncbi:putative class II RPD3 type histone deacetylase protein [Paratrimastix pyriformis]|uniref:Class II RPD3 type histone deacetylase protein n=1 Tax=Paratrimastix pyriformis TaxID=342808 RepID=A0ABQ8UH84_9EUKA|nr:putative class II RPD3 type histone deacetylase protein [Paratrimastix pyriformis]